ncbi:hypothetical protein [Kribbella sp. NPDC049227]|uniref:hypothetical protein n=1 Tax=Kribbella sp. NPDC049227 TaxID=3364113 RepID=UPI00371BBA4A
MIVRADDDLGSPVTTVRGTYFLRPGSQSIGEHITTWPTQQEQLVQKVDGAVRHCTGFTQYYPATAESARWKPKRLAIPGLVDGIAVRLETEDNSITWGYYVAYVVRGGTVLSLTTGSTVSEADFIRITKKAAERLRAASR